MHTISVVTKSTQEAVFCVYATFGVTFSNKVIKYEKN